MSLNHFLKKSFLIPTFVFTLLGLVTFSSLTSQPVAAAESCSQHTPINTQFRVEDGPWFSGTELSSRPLYQGVAIDINCFAKNGFAQLPGGVIDVTLPNGQTQRASSQPRVDDYTLSSTGTYVFRCSSLTIADCSDTDSVVVLSVTPVSCNNACSQFHPCQSGLSCVDGRCRNPSYSSQTNCTCLSTPVPTPKPTPVPTPKPTPVPTPKPTPTPIHKSSCDDLTVAGGNNSLVPAKVTLRARGSDSKGEIQRYKFYFGDGKQEESSGPEVTHTYESSGSFVARVDIKDSQGNWKTSSNCEERVTVKSSSVESHKSNCSDVFITADNGGKAPVNVQFRVTGYDNKGNIQRYKLDFGTGFEKESDGEHFEQRYEQAGTFTIKAYVKDSQGNWRGGEDGCKRTLYINTKTLTTQPATGTPTLLSVIGLGSGIVGVGVRLAQKYRLR